MERWSHGALNQRAHNRLQPPFPNLRLAEVAPSNDGCNDATVLTFLHQGAKAASFFPSQARGRFSIVTFLNDSAGLSHYRRGYRRGMRM
jgi:hypothetical protein